MNIDNIDNKESILPPETLNGRVNIIDIPSNVLFDMKEKVAVKNKASEYENFNWYYGGYYVIQSILR